MSDSTQESLWVLRAQVGDRGALDLLLQAVQGTLLRYLQNMLSDASLADDVLQDVLLILCRKLGTLREPRLFRPWAFRIASREAVRRLRRERRWRNENRELKECLNGEPPPDSAFDHTFEMELVKQSLSTLSPAVRAVIVLHYFECMTLSEVGTVLSLPEGTVKSRLAYGLKSLRRKLRGAGQGGGE